MARSTVDIPTGEIKPGKCHIGGEDTHIRCGTCGKPVCYTHTSFNIDDFFQCKSCYDIERFNQDVRKFFRA